MKTQEETVEIDAPSEQIFDLIHNYDRRLEWDPFLKEARLLGADQAGLGVKALCVARNRLGGLAMETVYVAFDRPKIAAVKMTRGPLLLRTFAATLRQDALADRKTRVIYKFNFEARPRWLRGVLTPICTWVFSHEVRKRLGCLKTFLEKKEISPP